MEQHYNLVDEPFIPLVGGESVSLREIFERTEPCRLALNSWYFIPVMRLLLCIGQAAVTLAVDSDWDRISFDEFRKRVIAYLEEHHDAFYLYGERPFLQFKALEHYFENEKVVKPLEAYAPFISFGNNLLFRSDGRLSLKLADSQKALMLIALTTHSLATKRIQMEVVLDPKCDKSKDSKISPFLGKDGGIMHSFYLGRSVAESVWINLVSEERVAQPGHGFAIMGRPCWELEITGERSCAAEELKQSYLGRLVPLVRFCLLDENSDNVICTNGIVHLTEGSHYCDFSMIRREGQKGLELLSVERIRRPWLNLDAFLSFAVYSSADKAQNYLCEQLEACFNHAKKQSYLAVWCGGLTVNITQGEQKISGDCDLISSVFELGDQEEAFNLDPCLEHFKRFRVKLENLEQELKRKANNYYKELFPQKEKEEKKDKENDIPAVKQGIERFWQQLDGLSQSIVEMCFSNVSNQKRAQMEDEIIKAVNQILYATYDSICPPSSARCLIVNQKNRPVGLKRLKA